MSKQGSSSNSPTNFFRGLSSRISSTQQQPVPPPQHSSPTKTQKPPSPPQPQQATAGSYNASTGQVTNALLTQAVQQPVPQQQRPPSAAGARRSASHSTSQQPKLQQSQSQENQQQQQHQQPVQQRVHASALIERARLIRSQPKNTSPIDPSAHPSLLPSQHPSMRGKKCLILDVDETLVHSSYQNTAHYDVHLPIPLDDNSIVNVYVAFRPYLMEFLETVAPLFEVVIFTASLARYCNPLMDSIDSSRILGDLRLFREHCSLVSSTFVKDLSLLGRPLDQVAIIDNSPVAYLFQQRNAIPITSWFDDPDDCELRRLIPVLEALAEAGSVYDVLDNYNALLQLQQQAGGEE